MCSTPQPSLLMSRDRLLHCLHRSTTCPWREDQIQSLISFSLFGHSGQKVVENFEGEHNTDIAQAQKLWFTQAVWFYFYFGLNYFSIYNSWIVVFVYSFYCFHLKLQYYVFNFSLIFSMFGSISMPLQHFFCTFKILPICLEYFTLVPWQDCSQMHILHVFCIGRVIGHASNHK